jgi:pyruvate kinase
MPGLPERRSKIVVTIGPASRAETVLEQLALAGMNVARLNFSHGDHATHRENADRVRRVSAKTGLPIGILQDLQGRRSELVSFLGKV